MNIYLFLFKDKITNKSDVELKSLNENFNLTITSTKAIATNRLSIVFQINKNDYEQIKLIYLLTR